VTPSAPPQPDARVEHDGSRRAALLYAAHECLALPAHRAPFVEIFFRGHDGGWVWLNRLGAEHLIAEAEAEGSPR
jgi:hypothetical protein